MRHREQPVRTGAARRRFDGLLAAGILVAEALLCTTLWVLQPAGWLWVGAQLNHETGSVSVGILVAFLGMLSTIMTTLALAMRLDRAWRLVRRAAGHEQTHGMLERIFVISMTIVGIAFAIWFFTKSGSGIDPGGSH